MSFFNKQKIGEVRPNQMITTFGPGAIIDALNDSITILDLDYWSQENIGGEIKDTRLASYMGVRHFYKPKTGSKTNTDIPIVSFPYSHICSKCHLIFDVRENFDSEKYKQWNGQVSCPDCGWKSFPSRFITICEDGHMDDFPYRWWVHKGNTSCNKKMYLKSTGSSSSLSELYVECECGAKLSLAGAMDKKRFEDYSCTENHPHRPRKYGITYKANCGCSITPSQRGASNVYFGISRNAISVPPWTNPINELMTDKRTLVESYEQDFGEIGLQKAYEKYFAPNGYSRDDFDEAYKRLKEKIKEFMELKEMEYKAIINHTDIEYQHDVEYFQAEDEEIKPGLKSYFSRVIKIHRLREVRVLTGFTRLEAPDPEVDSAKHIVKLNCGKGEKWLPAVEVYGEGVFLELNKDRVKTWLSNQKVYERSEKYNQCYDEYAAKKGWENYKPRNGEYVLLHTLSHMLIKEMAMQSGYSSTSLHERIYSSSDMCGLLIYTGAADKEGSLGGLVELGNMNKYIPLLKDALEHALTCTTDPECFMRNPTTDRINGAACHSCTMISETACENGNRLLDRALVVPLPDMEEMGYFREFVNDVCGIQV